MSDGTVGRFDAIVVGGGAAGLACAATLSLQGLRPLLIAETEEVGHNLRSEWVDGCRGLVQHPAWQVAWGGGWWYGLVRALNINVDFHVAPPIHLRLRGQANTVEAPLCASAAAATQFLLDASPLPFGDHRDEFERVLHDGFTIPADELQRMHDVRLSDWLEDRRADPALQLLIYAMVANIAETSSETARQHISVFGGMGMIRSFLTGEGFLTVIKPDAREGLLIPIARAIEARGGTVWRGRKARRVIVQDATVRGVEMVDGTVAEADVVALAVGNPRMPALLDVLPSELEAPLAYSKQLGHKDFTTFALLDKPVVKLDRYIMYSDLDGSNLVWTVPLHSLAPWTVTDGRQFVLAQSFFTDEVAEETGGPDKIYPRMWEYQEELYPGFTDAITHTATQEHRHHWTLPLCFGPKVPRKVDSVAGLWCVNDGSTPIAGIGVEAAMSAGVLGGRAIRAAMAAGPSSKTAAP